MTDAELTLLVFASDGLEVFATLRQAEGYMEAIDVDNGEYRALFTVDGRVVEAQSVGRDGPVRLVVTDNRQPDQLVQELRSCSTGHRLVSPPEDPLAVANELLRREWAYRRNRRPRWLSRRRHGDEPPAAR